MFNDSELATLRNRFKRDAELLMQATTSAVDGEKSKLKNATPANYVSLLKWFSVLERWNWKTVTSSRSPLRLFPSNVLSLEK